MSVQVLTDNSSCLPPDVAQAAGITIVELHTNEEDGERTTAGLGALELTACYARLLERGHDDGVVAIHISKELSATWSNAVTAAGIFDGLVRVLDTNTAGMANGYAALRAAEVASAGGTVEEVAHAAQTIIAESQLWLYLHRIDNMRRGGRLSTGQTLLSTALAIKPILRLVDGRVALAAKTRTMNKAMDKLVEMVAGEVAQEAREAAVQRRPPRSVRVAVQQMGAVEASEKLITAIGQRVEELKEQAVAKDGQFSEAAPRAGDAATGRGTGGDVRAGQTNTDDAGAEDAAGIDAGVVMPRVEFTLLEITGVLGIHTGPGAIAVSTVRW